MTSGQFKISISTLPAGYAYSMGQPSVTLSILLESPSMFSMEAAQIALSEIFLLPAEDFPPVRILANQEVTKPLSDFLQCSFGLARHLLQEGGVPAFAVEVIHKIVRVEGAPSRYKIQLRAPTIDHLPRKLLCAAYFHALSTMWHFTKPESQQQGLKAAVDNLSTRFVIPLRKGLRRGLSTKPFLKEAYNQGIPISHLGNGLFQLGTGASARLVNKGATDQDSAIGANVANEKDIAQVLFESVGAPVAEFVLVHDSNAAVDAAHKLGFPVVVKPANLERSQGVFLDIKTEDAVRHAYNEALKLSSRILVQRQIPGHCHRLVAFNGRFVFGYTRYPAGVEGDSIHSVRELVEAFNDAHHRKAEHLQEKPMPFDDEALSCLLDQNLCPDDILEKGQVAFLRTHNVTDYAAYNKIVTDTVHPANISIVERLSRVFRLESVGVDLICADPTRPWYETGGAITEVNYQPQIGKNTARANIAAMFPEGSSATIPIECFVGGKGAMRAGRRRLEALASQKLSVALTSHDTTLDQRGQVYHLAGLNGLYARCSALLRDREIEILVVVVQTDELLGTGPPFRGNVKVTQIDSGVQSHADPGKSVQPSVLALLRQALNGK